MERKVCTPTRLCFEKETKHAPDVCFVEREHTTIKNKKEKTYKDLLRDKRWISKRNKILSRDNNTCCYCGCNDRYLHVHHLRYIEDKKPWEYSDEDLITLCEKCHKNETDASKESYKLYQELKNSIRSNNISFCSLNQILSMLIDVFKSHKDGFSPLHNDAYDFVRIAILHTLNKKDLEAANDIGFDFEDADFSYIKDYRAILEK